MTITVCPAAMTETGKCWDPQCHLRHDVVHCEPCKCFVLHGELWKHRRGEDHRLKSGFGKWKTDARRPALAILPSPYPCVPKSKPSKKRTRKLARRKGVACIGSLPARNGEAEHIFVSGQEGFDFKSEVGVGKDKKTKSAIPVIIQKAWETPDDVGLTLVGFEVTGAGSEVFSAVQSLPMKIKGTKQRTVNVSFVPTWPGEWNARLLLRFLHVSKGKRVTFAITRRLHGVATSPVAKPQAPGKKKRTAGVREHAGSSGKTQLRNTWQHRDTRQDNPFVYVGRRGRTTVI